VKFERVCPRLDSPEGEVKGGARSLVSCGTHRAHDVKRQRLDMGIYRCMHCLSIVFGGETRWHNSHRFCDQLPQRRCATTIQGGACSCIPVTASGEPPSPQHGARPMRPSDPPGVAAACTSKNLNTSVGDTGMAPEHGSNSCHSKQRTSEPAAWPLALQRISTHPLETLAWLQSTGRARSSS